MVVQRAVDAGHDVVDLVGLLPQNGEVRPEDPDDDGLLATADDLLDPLVEVGLSLPEQPRVFVGEVLDRLQRLVVVDRRVDAHPVLTEIHPGHLLPQEGLADVRSEVPQPGISRSAWLTLVVVRSISASEVPGWVTQWMRKSGLEVGEEGLPESGSEQDADRGHGRHDGVGPRRPADHLREQSRSPLEDAHQWRFVLLDRGVAQQDERQRGVSVTATTIDATIASV